MSRWDGFPNSWGYKRAGRESGRGRRRKQTCVCVKPVSSERANKEIFCQVTSETARVEKKRSLVVKGVAIGEAGGHEGERLSGGHRAGGPLFWHTCAGDAGVGEPGCGLPSRWRCYRPHGGRDSQEGPTLEVCGLVSTNVLSASCARDVTTRKSSVGFEGLAERMARAYRGHHPLLAVFQPSKDKVRPVMDYRELNDLSNAILAI
ncbi:hypothetical protein GQR58_028122 [Nymphon striatum]|nr:hypothetical protein GQR58_028122 [Nymphon striatum]